jgi:hypothetical protein
MAEYDYVKTIPVAEPTDVLVVGSGPSGLGAAIASGRAGASTRLVERFGFLGGDLTAGMVHPCMTSFSLDGSTQLVRGIFDEFIRRLEAKGAAVHPSLTKSGTPYSGFMKYGHEAVTPFDHEAAKLESMDMCDEAGVDVLLHSFAIDTVVDQGKVKGVIVGNKSGLMLLPAEVVVDCTGDGDVVANGGGKFEFGRDEDGLTQPMSLFFRIADADDARIEEYKRNHPEEHFPYQHIVEQAQEEGSYDLPRRGVQLFKTMQPGVWSINTTRVLGMDGTDVADLTQAEKTARHQIPELMRFFHDRLPGLENARVLDSAPTIGVRESRRISGNYTLTLEDLVEGRHFEDVIAVAGYPVDIHSPSSSSGPFDEDDIPSTANVYEIPYGALVPNSLDGVIAAGRCISATHEALAAIRVMPPAFAIGQAAGEAAAMAVNDQVSPAQINVSALQERLVRTGAYLGNRYASDTARVG